MTQTSDTLLRLQDVSKRFGKKTALDHISLEIAPGRMVGLLGSNGSGKSTLIKLINGLLVPSSGQIFICGQTPGPETKAIVSYLPERTYLPDTVRVKGLLSFSGIFIRTLTLQRRRKCCKSSTSIRPAP